MIQIQKTLFVSFEGSGIFDIVDAKTLAILGKVTAPSANDLAGMVVDQHKQKLYTVDRGHNFIYIYNWDATTKTLTLDKTQTLSGASQIFGLALDETNDVLYVGDITASVKSFKTSDWSSAGVYSLASGLTSMGVAVDDKNGLIYTGNALDAGWLSKIDINTHAETRFNIRTLPGAVSDDNVVGLAVDYDTGLLYITTGNQYGTGSDRLIVFDKNLNKLYNTIDIGNPTGLVVPRKEISYNPLNLAKIADKNCVESGDTLTYSISYQNTNPTSVDNVVITDTLPSDVTYVSNTGGGSYSSGEVTWNLELWLLVHKDQ